MSYEQDVPQKIRFPTAEPEAIDTRTLTGNVTLSRLDGKFHILDPGGANRNVTLYACTPEDIGRSEYVYNAADAAEDLVVKNSAGTTLITLGQSQWTQVICNESRAHVVIGRGASAVSSSTDTITETTPTAGVTIDGLRIKDSTINPAAGGTAFIDLSNVATGEADVILKDNLAIALEIREAANSYIKIATTNSAELVTFGVPVAYAATAQLIADPGNAGAIPVTRDGTCSLTSAGAETRTLAIPTYNGQRLALVDDVHVGNIVVTCAQAINQAGNTIMTFGAVNDFIELVGVTCAGGALRWRVAANDGVALS